MATRNNPPDVIRRWSEHTTGIIGSSGSSIADVRHQDGWKRDKGEAKTDTVYPYKGYVVNGSVVRMAVPSFRSASHPSVWQSAPAQLLNAYGVANSWIAPARNKSFDKLMDRVKGPQASLGQSFGEGRETLEMVAKRVGGLRKAYSSLRRGDFKQFCKELSVDPKRKHRSMRRSSANEAAGLWLEYWWGWSPTVSDIHDSAVALSTMPFLVELREHGTSGFDRSWDTSSLSGVNRTSVQTSMRGFVKQGCTISIKNPNLFLANRVGLVNPASILWEISPMTVVVDWFTNFGGYLEGLTALAGLDVKDSYTTLYARTEVDTAIGEGAVCRTKHIMYSHQRSTSLSRPVPVFPLTDFLGGSKSRAASAVSLLTALFLKG